MGTYEWLCVAPMGLKCAPFYSQQQKGQTVLCEMIYQILQLYLYDIIVYGTTEEAHLTYLRQVFDDLHNIEMQELQVWYKAILSLVNYINDHVETPP